MHISFLGRTPQVTCRPNFLRRLIVLCIAFFSIAACTGVHTEKGDQPADVVGSLPATADISGNHFPIDVFLTALKDGDYARAFSKFDNRMKAALSPQKLQEAWESQIANLGQLGRWTTVQKTLKEGYEVATVIVEYEKGRVKMTISVSTKTLEIGGLYFVRDTAGAAAPSRQQHEFPTEKIVVGKQPFLLDGEIIFPHGKGPFPAAVLVQGSGPQNMDSTIGANEPFRDLATGLASRGVAVLRYNKRFFQYPQAGGQVTVQEEVIDDAVAAVKLLKANALVRSGDLYVVGHSLGAQLAPIIAAQSQSVDGLVLLAPPGRTPRSYITDQMRYLGAPAETVQQIDDGFAKLESGQNNDVTILGVPGSYWKDLYARDGIEVAKSLGKPILILRGERDYQVGPEDFSAWRRGLKDSKFVVMTTIPKLNHLFIKGEGKAGPQEYNVPGHVEPLVLDRIADFIKSDAHP